MEVINVMNPKKREEVIDSLDEFFNINLISEDGKIYPVKSSMVTSMDFKAYFEIPNLNNNRNFNIQIYNTIDSQITFTILLVKNSFKMINLNEYNYEIVHRERSKIYEVLTVPNQILFMDLRMCHGEAEVAFYESDYEKITKK